jgi:hypothetical protein
MTYDRTKTYVGSDVVLGLRHKRYDVLVDAYAIDHVDIYDPNGVKVVTIPGTSVVHEGTGIYKVIVPGSVFTMAGTYRDYWGVIPTSNGVLRHFKFEINVLSLDNALNIRPAPVSDLLVSADWVRTNFLFGVDLRDDEGNTMPDTLIEFYIRSATEWLESELGIYLRPLSVNQESHDYFIDDYNSFSFMKLFRTPVRRINKIQMQFPFSSGVIDFNPEWIKADSFGLVNLVPTQGTLSQIFITEGGSWLPMLYSTRLYLPCVFFVDYEAGFEQGKVPNYLLELIGMRAAMGPLNIAGDLVAGAAIASKSLSMDGLSQSIGTTASATNAGYGARILQYLKQINETLATQRNYWRGINFTVA